MAKRDHTQGFAFVFGKTTISFLHNGDVEKFIDEEVTDDVLKLEAEKLLVNAMEMFESGYHDPYHVLDVLIEELIDLQKKSE
jgi:hypothetical protein